MGHKRILIIDDEENFAQMVKLNLEATGKYEVCLECAGEKALAVIREYKPDFIFLDVIMPDLDGPQLVKLIESEELLKDIPIVFLTGVATKSKLNIQGDTIAGHLFIEKPATTQQLISCIEKHIRN